MMAHPPPNSLFQSFSPPKKKKSTGGPPISCASFTVERAGLLYLSSHSKTSLTDLPLELPLCPHWLLYVLHLDLQSSHPASRSRLDPLAPLPKPSAISGLLQALSCSWLVMLLAVTAPGGLRLLALTGSFSSRSSCPNLSNPPRAQRRKGTNKAASRCSYTQTATGRNYLYSRPIHSYNIPNRPSQGT